MAIVDIKKKEHISVNTYSSNIIQIIWMCIFPVVLIDITVSSYQAICFPLYGIPKVKRQDYIVFDRQYLHYLNIIEKINFAGSQPQG